MEMQRSLMGLVAAAGMTAGAVGTAAGQCDLFWPGIPDFDQRRVWAYDPFPIVTHVGLPNNGGVHCVPTATSNILAILDDSGYNVIVGASGPGWDAQVPFYNAIGTHIGNLGVYMDTDDGGTTHGDAIDGMLDWLDDRGQGSRFMAVGFKADDDEFPRPTSLYALLQMGWPATFGYGRYYRDGDELERDGGHCVSLVGTLDGCDLMRPQVMYHDPATKIGDESRLEQSEFTRVTRTLYRRFWNMDGDNAAVYSFDETFNGTADDPVRVFDSYRAILPLCLLGSHPVNPNQIQWHQLGGVFKGASPKSETSDTPNLGNVIDIAFDHTDISYLVTAAAGRGGAAGIFRVDIPTGSSRRVQTFDRSPDRVLVDRYGHHYVQLGALVEKYKLVDDRPIPLGSITLPNPISAWAIDDATDTIVCLAQGNTRLIRFGVGLGIVGNTPIPSGVSLPGDGSVAINPRTGKAWVTSLGTAGLFEVTFDPANGRASFTDTASHANLRNIRGFSFDRTGKLLVASDGLMRPFAVDPRSGRWVPDADSPWNEFRSLPMGRLSEMTRTRHNENARNLTPGWRDIDPENEPVGDQVPVCGADFNLDGFLDFFDYADYVRCYEGDGCPRGRDADHNLDNFTDFFDYTAFVEDFERGC